ncbi:hypothetical protein LTR78_008513 [Recurvomyces mirabilis]|uniref:Cytochrome P450 n=1 Tax=Recurvomyces mirabilis TaxID=574656 RepID=A0AAE0TTL3_9PEZI|nr:hypothetical protein LTR78_008513 [Recurvomyces mirabilis]
MARYTPLPPGWEQSIVLSDDVTHARLRKMYGAAFTSKALEEQSGLLLRYANLMIAQLKVALQQDPTQDVSAWYNFVTFDLTGEFAFGEAFNCLVSGGQYHFFMKTVFEGVVVGLQLGALQIYGVMTLLEPFIPRSVMKPKEDMDNYAQALVDKRAERGYDPNVVDVMNYLLQQKEQEGELSREALHENGIALVVAGAETTATLLTATTYFLCRNPDTLKKVQQEVRSAFKSDEEIDVRSVNNLPYMIAVLSEGLRVFPPSPWGFVRRIASKAGQDVAGNYVPHNVYNIYVASTLPAQC